MAMTRRVLTVALASVALAVTASVFLAACTGASGAAPVAPNAQPGDEAVRGTAGQDAGEATALSSTPAAVSGDAGSTPLTGASPAPVAPAQRSPATRGESGDLEHLSRFVAVTDKSGTRSIWFEAEEMTADPSLTTVRDPDALGGAFLKATAPGQRWDGQGAAPAIDQASAVVSVPKAGRYAVWVRMRYANAQSSSLWLRVDGGKAIRVGNDTSGYGVWKWVGWHDGREDLRVHIDLRPGDHVITLLAPEQGVAIDSILVTSDLEMTPTG
jgi:hypothetical protein